MAKVVVKSKVKKIKRKFPVEIVAPQSLASSTIGRADVTDLSTLVGRTSKLNLMHVTGNARNQNIRLTFKVTEVSSGKAVTEVKSYEQIPYYLGRQVKKGSDLVEDSFDLETKDGAKVRVKPFMITKQNASSIVKSSLRQKSRDLLTEDALTKTYDEFVGGVIHGKVQATFRNELKKIFPLKMFELRRVEKK